MGFESAFESSWTFRMSKMPAIWSKFSATVCRAAESFEIWFCKPAQYALRLDMTRSLLEIISHVSNAPESEALCGVAKKS
jgi:hypothetical protein